jgi:hypothetical protein
MEDGIGLAAQRAGALAQVQTLAQIRDADLPLRDLNGRCRRQQPLRERFLSHPGPSRAEQLEETPFPEQIQICGIYVMEIGESVSPVAGTGPSVIQPSEPAAIELRRTAIA